MQELVGTQVNAYFSSMEASSKQEYSHLVGTVVRVEGHLVFLTRVRNVRSSSDRGYDRPDQVINTTSSDFTRFEIVEQEGKDK